MNFINKIGSIIGITLFAIGVIGFIFTILGKMFIPFSENVEFPVVDYFGSKIESNEIKIGNGYRNAIQIYDLKGNFIKSENVGSYHNLKGEFYSNQNSNFKLKSKYPFYLEIKKTNKKIEIKQSIFLHYLNPFAYWIVSFFSLILLLILNPTKLPAILISNVSFKEKRKRIYMEILKF